MASVQLKSLDDGNITDVPESGITVVGRGPFLEITDKRVSRNHANLEIVDGKLYLTPIHVNPCFFKKGGEGSQKILEKDEKFCLEEGDVFGLLPDQLFFKVLYKNKPVNGDVKKEPESVPSQTNGDTKSETKADPDESWDNEKEVKKTDDKVETKPDIKYEVKSENNNDKASSSSGAGPSTVTPPGQKEMALPLERKRQLPAWLVQAAKSGPSPEKKKPSPKVHAASKRAPRAATSKPIPEAFLTDGEDDEVIPVKKSRGRPAPRKPPKDTLSEGESEEEPPPKPKNRSKTLTPGTRTPRRKDQFDSDDDDSDEPISRKAKPIPRRTARPPTPESFTPSKRPVRAAKYARGSYEDDESDDYDEFGSQKKYEEDSDFIMEDDDSGSDWGSKKSKGKGKGKAAAKNTPKPRSTAKGGRSSRSRGRSRKSRSDVDSDEYLDEYVPRPSKRRASKAAKSESEEESSPPPKPRGTKKKKKPDSEDDDDDDEDDEPKKRKPCEFGKKCYRKNPAHFKECCHPGDKSYDEAEDDEVDDEDKPECPYGTSCFRTNPAHQEQYSHNNKPKKDASRPKRETAGKKSVLEGDEDDNGERNTYDYNDSFLDNNEAEESEESFFDPAEEDSDYDPESEDVAGLVKEAKSFQKNRKLVKPARSR